MTYNAILFDCPVSSADKNQATELFCAAIETHFGGEQAVADAYRAFDAAFMSYGETPLPSCATDAERASVDRWYEALHIAEQAAFDGWSGDLRGAHFEISLV